MGNLIFSSLLAGVPLNVYIMGYYHGKGEISTAYNHFLYLIINLLCIFLYAVISYHGSKQ